MSEYNRSEKLYSKREGPSMCACMGRVYGEPFCPCEMGRQGLPMSKEHVVAAERDRLALADLFDKLNRGVSLID
jgi:hypothetical protein